MHGLRWQRIPVEAPNHAPPVGSAGFCWSTPRSRMVARGVAAEVSASGPGRLARLAVEGDLRWVGGFAFEDEVEGPWAPFGAARFFAPRMMLIVEDGRAVLQLAWREGEPSPRDEALAWLGEAVAPGRDEVFAVEREPAEVHRERVEACIAELRSGRIDKIVVSRETRLKGRFHPQRLWARLPGEDHEHARFGLFVDGAGFIGQTPETLVRREGEWLWSEALAGSAALEAADQLLDQPKDRAEHAKVVEAVAGVLGDLGSLDQIGPPRLRRLRAIAHLWTPIRARSSASVLEAGARLHPTPATGGVPMREALPLLGRIEGRPRGWYCGAVGWVDGRGDGDLRVALRAALALPDELRLFVGGGIMADSDPAREWTETMWKEQAIVDALGLTLP